MMVSSFLLSTLTFQIKDSSKACIEAIHSAMKTLNKDNSNAQLTLELSQ